MLKWTLVFLLMSLQSYAKVSFNSRGDLNQITISLPRSAKILRSELVRGMSRLKTLDEDFTHVGQYTLVGNPNVPVYRFYVMGEKSEVEKLKVKYAGENQPVVVRGGLEPVQAPRLKMKNARTPKLALNKEIYTKDSFYPQKDIEFTYAGSIHGVKKWLVTVFPYHYNPVSKEIKTFEKVILSYKTSRSEKLLERKLKSRTQKVLLFVVGQKFKDSESLKKYMEYKSQEYKIEKWVAARNLSPDQIRSKIQKVYQEYKTNFAATVIVGDYEDVSSYKSGSYITDHYYRAIDTDDYKSDINGPDIGVGRFSVSDENELSNVVNKLINHQNFTNFGEYDLYKPISFLASTDNFEISEGTHNFVKETYTTKMKYIGQFPKADILGGDELYSKTHSAGSNEVLEQFGVGRTLINYSGHGDTTYWYKPRVTEEDVYDLPYTGYYPFVISNACLTGAFNIDESYAESWLRAKNGAVGFWGATTYTYWDEDDVLEKSFYAGAFNVGLRTVAQTTENALSEVWKYYGGQGLSVYYWEVYTIFGDSTLNMDYIFSQNNKSHRRF
ncbi:MAG: hypothetical protein H6621_08245 [Halobacteriovoraceae bacterium]|nr:hypothetical protein [Halobacteriovoraceae bacterium]